jgi:hypothetical protein
VPNGVAFGTGNRKECILTAWSHSHASRHQQRFLAARCRKLRRTGWKESWSVESDGQCMHCMQRIQHFEIKHGTITSIPKTRTSCCDAWYDKCTVTRQHQAQETWIVLFIMCTTTCAVQKEESQYSYATEFSDCLWSPDIAMMTSRSSIQWYSRCRKCLQNKIPFLWKLSSMFLTKDTTGYWKQSS